MKKLLWLLVWGVWAFVQSPAQELFVSVSVDYNQVGQGDKQVFQDMQRAITEYINMNKWTNDKFDMVERIRCNLRIIVSQRPAADYFRCTANLQIYRPAFNSTYETVLANLSDQNFNFNFLSGQPLQYNENSYTDNLTALLNFYAYIILGFDYASFAPNGGTPYFKKAQEWVNLSASSPEQGWTSTGLNQNNRFWLAENLNNSSYRVFQDVLYKYHRNGIDQMSENLPRARKAILECAQDMQKINRQNPLLFITRVFLDAKSDEMIKIFQGAFANDKKTFVEIMTDLNPKDVEKYQQVMK